MQIFCNFFVFFQLILHYIFPKHFFKNLLVTSISCRSLLLLLYHFAQLIIIICHVTAAATTSASSPTLLQVCNAAHDYDMHSQWSLGASSTGRVLASSTKPHFVWFPPTSTKKTPSNSLQLRINIFWRNHKKARKKNCSQNATSFTFLQVLSLFVRVSVL